MVLSECNARVLCAGLGAAQQALATSMEQFEFACIGASMTEDERVISRSLHHFATLIRTIEDERDRMVSNSVPTHGDSHTPTIRRLATIH